MTDKKKPDKTAKAQIPRAQRIPEGAFEVRIPANYEVWSCGVYERKLDTYDPSDPWPLASPDVAAPYEHKAAHLKRITHCPIWTSRSGTFYGDDTMAVKMHFGLPDGSLRTLWFPAGLVTDAVRLKALADIGLDVNSNTAAALVAFIAGCRGANRDLPHARVVRRVGYYDIDGEPAWLVGQNWIGPENTNIECDAQAHTQLMRAYTTSPKTAEPEDAFLEWRSFVTRYLFGDQGAQLARWVCGQMCLPPIAPLIGQRGMVVNLYGQAGTGKSALSALALTMFGCPENGHLFQGLNKTSNAVLEIFENQVSAMPLLLDELQVLDQRFNKATLIYQLVLGQGKGRLDSSGTRIGGADKKFLAIVQTTGESNLIQKDVGGQSARVIEVDMTETTTPPIEEIRGIYKWIRERRLWGWAGLRFLRVFRADWMDLDQREVYLELRNSMRTNLERYVPHQTSLDMLTSVAFAEFLMLYYLFLDSGDRRADWDEAIDLAVQDARFVYSSSVESARRDQVRPLAYRAMDALREHLAANPALYPNLDDPTALEGLAKGHGKTFSGFISQGEVIYLNSGFNAICEKDLGVSGQRVLNDLSQKNWCLRSGEYNRVHRQRAPWIPKARYIVIPREILLEKAEPTIVNTSALATWTPDSDI